MNTEKLAKSLEPWMRASTWHTSHSLDQRRFHKALSGAIETHGSQISFDNFRDAIEFLLEQLHPDQNPDNFRDDIDRYAIRAESIASYIYDISQA